MPHPQSSIADSHRTPTAFGTSAANVSLVIHVMTPTIRPPVIVGFILLAANEAFMSDAQTAALSGQAVQCGTQCALLLLTQIRQMDGAPNTGNDAYEFPLVHSRSGNGGFLSFVIVSLSLLLMLCRYCRHCCCGRCNYFCCCCDALWRLSDRQRFQGGTFVDCGEEGWPQKPSGQIQQYTVLMLWTRSRGMARCTLTFKLLIFGQPS